MDQVCAAANIPSGLQIIFSPERTYVLLRHHLGRTVNFLLVVYQTERAALKEVAVANKQIP